VIIEALQWTGFLTPKHQEFFGEFIDALAVDKFDLLIPTLEGALRASHGDYIIKGVKGEFYPCKPDIFELTYDLVED
jgi:hypothetical protein